MTLPASHRLKTEAAALASNPGARDCNRHLTLLFAAFDTLADHPSTANAIGFEKLTGRPLTAQSLLAVVDQGRDAFAKRFGGRDDLWMAAVIVRDALAAVGTAANPQKL